MDTNFTNEHEPNWRKWVQFVSHFRPLRPGENDRHFYLATDDLGFHESGLIFGIGNALFGALWRGGENEKTIG